MKTKISCKQAVNYISKKEEGKLTAWQRVELWRHISVCSLCKIFSRQNKLITKALSGYKKPAQPDITEADKQTIINTILNK